MQLKKKKIVYQKPLKRTFKPVLSTKSPFEFVFLRCEFTEVIYSQKAGVNCSYLTFLVYKNIYF